MANKLFQESDEWNDGEKNNFNFSVKNGKSAKLPADQKPKQKKKNRKRKNQKTAENGEESVGGMFVRAPHLQVDPDVEKEPQKNKNKKRKHVELETPEPEKTKKQKKPQEVEVPESSSFADKLRENLKGSRFRFLNEQMYKTKSTEAQKLFKEDSTAFEAYHEGYRHQISQWPMNPLDRIINGIKRMPKNCVVADMGCGDARLSKSVLQKVYSLDLVAGADGVIECDMSKTPLETNAINVVVYCLSLMGINLKDFFLEANRILKIGGIIKIAEVSSRFDSIDKFVEFVEKCGFELVSKDLSHNLFYFVNFKKTHNVNDINKKIPDYSLKPCLYKKR